MTGNTKEQAELILSTKDQIWISDDVEMIDDTSYVKFVDAINAMEEYRGSSWISTSNLPPPDYIDVIYIDNRDDKHHIGQFVWSQTPSLNVLFWMPLHPFRTTLK